MLIVDAYRMAAIFRQAFVQRIVGIDRHLCRIKHYERRRAVAIVAPCVEIITERHKIERVCLVTARQRSIVHLRAAAVSAADTA